jgi:hypothetical protein
MLDCGVHIAALYPMSQEVVEHVRAHAKREPSFTGLAVYLEVCTHYASAFKPGTRRLDVVRSLACVVFFMRIWEAWLRKSHGSTKSVEQTCVTSATRTDLEISAACVINLLAFQHDCPGMEEVLPFKLGSDCNEDLFGFLGTWRSNSRTYTAMAACDKV